LYAFDARTGVERWRRNIGERPFGVVAAAGRLYFGTRRIDAGGLGAGHLLAWNVGDGSEIWRVPIPDRTGTSYTGGSIGFPAVLTDRVVFTTVSGLVYAVDLRAGDTLWTSGSAGSWNSYYAGPVIADQRIVAVRYDGLVTALDPATGHELWSLQVRAPPARPASDGKSVFVSDGQLRAITATGSVAWSFPPRQTDEDYITQPPAVRDGVVYVAGPRSLLALRAYP
jgi:outer membrane protein assembly factor BamB